MQASLLRLAIAAALAATPAAAQNRAKPAPPRPVTAQALSGAQSIGGKWTYRSFISTPDLVAGDPTKALDLIFGEGVFTLETPSRTTVKGTLDMGEGLVLDLNGTVRPAAAGAPLIVEIAGIGRAGTPTNGWEYDYHGYLAYPWPNGVNQVPCLVGSVIRAKPHNGAPAGFVASFIAVKQP
jgi:hypothetical protein